MQNIISVPGDHRKRLQKLLTSTTGVVRIASAYVTDSQFLCSARKSGREVRLLTAITRSDVDCGATSLQALRELVKCGVQCRCLFERPKLHAKVYIMGHDSALVTSANLTHNAFDCNIEVGACVQDEAAVNELTNWYDSLWASATPLDAALVTDLMRQADVSHNEYLLQRSRQPLIYPKSSQHATILATSTQGVKSSRQYFLCNTNRKYSDEAEALMKKCERVAAWEDFSYTSHMKQVSHRDVIFMYKNGVGVIAIGEAKERCSKVEPGRNNLVVSGATTTEWQIPVSWLIWVDAEQAAAWCPVLPKTFVNISDSKYAERRRAVIQHLLGDEATPS